MFQQLPPKLPDAVNRLFGAGYSYWVLFSAKEFRYHRLLAGG